MNTQNFYNELFKCLCDDTDISENEDSCLISMNPLQEDHVTLHCKHKFNYNEIYQEVIKQKHNANPLDTQRLFKNQIKCPYCRNIQNEILPPNSNFSNVLYVNTPIKYCMHPYNCEYTFKSGKNKGILCNKPCFSTYCKNHDKIIKNQNNKLLEKSLGNTTNNKNVKLCKAEIKTGKNKGNVCNKVAKFDGYCGKHKNMCIKSI